MDSLISFLAPITKLQHLIVAYGSDFKLIYNPQQHLKSLICQERDCSLPAFITPEIRKTLRLQRFSDCANRLNIKHKENYQLFLESQKTCVESLSIETNELWPSIIRLDKIKSLETTLFQIIPLFEGSSLSLQSLILFVQYMYNAESIENFIMHFPNLRNLRLYFRGFDRDETILTFSQLSHLESVSVTVGSNYKLMILLKIDKMKEFYVSNIDHYDVDFWNDFLERCPNIKVLCINDSCMTNEIITSICDKLKDLENFTINSNILNPIFNLACDRQSLKIILKNCAKLIKLKMCLTGTYASYRPLFIRFKNKLQNITCTFEYSEIDFLATGEEDEFDVSDESYSDESYDSDEFEAME